MARPVRHLARVLQGNSTTQGLHRLVRNISRVRAVREGVKGGGEGELGEGREDFCSRGREEEMGVVNDSCVGITGTV